jgi:hypothetical protein
MKTSVIAMDGEFVIASASSGVMFGRRMDQSEMCRRPEDPRELLHEDGDRGRSAGSGP